MPASFLFPGLVRTVIGIQALVGDHQPLDRPSAKNVRVENLIDIGERNMPVPDRFRVDDHIGTMLTLIKAASLVGAYPSLESAFRYSGLEGLM